ncbi:helix-turn-helix domain-containing protein [Floricoccus penangensis]|uniref:helix-turn-helix domain-containing protein n=1 Tax=Floricoccus penangensis TaxID=1859475 RepID=UPI00203C06A8|nr:Rgg/GadR/MutR family transcriptional regulator [Floricoccus penangensis]URZ87028.1 helix-turn-helix domain-containing protein [Floricoccus penangensis]
MKMTNEELGIFFREIRKARGLTLKDVASEQVTVSQLSRFERGETVLSFEKLFATIEAMNMGIEEFTSAMNGYSRNNNQNFRRKISIAYNEKNIFALENMLKEYENKDLTTYQRLQYIIVQSNLIQVARYREKYLALTNEDILFATDYLMAIDEWTIFEVELFRDLTFFIKNESLFTLANEMIARTTFYIENSKHRESVVTSLMFIYIRFINEKDKKKCLFFRKKIESLLTKDMVSYRINMKMLNLFYDYHINNEKAALFEMNEVIRSLNIVGLDDLSLGFQREFEFFLKDLEDKNS